MVDKILSPSRKLIGKIAGRCPPSGGLSFLVRRGSGWKSGLSATYMFTKRSAGPF